MGRYCSCEFTLAGLGITLGPNLEIPGHLATVQEKLNVAKPDVLMRLLRLLRTPYCACQRLELCWEEQDFRVGEMPCGVVGLDHVFVRST